MTVRRCLLALIASAALLGAIGCKGPQPTSQPASAPGVDPMLSINTLHPAPDDYARSRVGTPEYPIPPWAKHLKGVRIALDPGHGGDSQLRAFKRGPTGVREAEMNLRVGQYLREFLLAAGAEVRLTRESDVDLSHADRAAVANDWPADLFISLHHNAIDNKPQVNYTTVWYHGTIDHSPSSLDLARHLCHALYDGIALPQIADVPLKSDQLMYPDGFAVLRHARVTAALVETSFYTNPDEEQRLRRPEYNLREAYALFLGLARYSYTGLPRLTLVEPSSGRLPPGQNRALGLVLDDGLRWRKAWGHQRQMILSDSIVARIDGRVVEHAFTNEEYRLRVNVPDDLAPGEHTVEVQFHNLFKNAVLNPRATFVVEKPLDIQ